MKDLDMGVSMDGKVTIMRIAHPLEYLLYQELTQPIADWVDRYGQDAPPPPNIIQKLKEIRKEVERFGLRPTPMGLFAIEERDILDQKHPTKTMDFVNRMWVEAWLQTIGQMKRRHAYFQ